MKGHRHGASGKEFSDKQEMLETQASIVPFLPLFLLVAP